MQRPPEPVVLDESGRAASGVDDDVGPEAAVRHLARWIQLAEPVQRRRGEYMQDCAVEERALGQIEVGDSVAEVQPLHVGPVLLGSGRPRVRRRGLYDILLAGLG